jgi:hypothetical protein
MRRNLLVGTIASVLATGCGSLDYEFEFEHESPVYVIDSPQPSAEAKKAFEDLGVFSDATTIDFSGGWTGFRFEPEVEDLPPELIGITVVGAALHATDGLTGEPALASFVERMELYVIGVDGMPSFLLASYTAPRGGDPEAAQGQLTLEVVEEVNLRDYLAADASFYCYLQGQRPAQLVSVQLMVDFHAYTRANP